MAFQKPKLRLLLICHHGGRTGAPLVFLRLAKWLSRQPGIEITTTILTDGPLASEFAQCGSVVSPVELIDQSKSSGKFLQKWRFGRRRKENIASHFDLIYANTICVGEFLSKLPRDIPVISHVHELDYWFSRVPQKPLDFLMSRTTFFVAASNAVSNYLVDVRDVPVSKIGVCHEFIDPLVRASKEECAALRRTLNIPPNARVVVGSGCEFWRKGRDLVPILLKCLCESFEETHFLWIGHSGPPEDEERLDFDLQRLNVKKRYHRIGEVANPIQYFSLGQVFALLSRDDPFPLVCLENVAVGNPVVCFEGAGGMPEFIGKVPDWVIPYGKIHLMAERINHLLSKTNETACRVELLKGMLENNYMTNVVAPKILDLIEATARPS